MTCDAAIRPFPTSTEVRCEVEGTHPEHSGILRGFAYPGSETKIGWFETDRRNFHGEWPGWCKGKSGCPLPDGHRGSHE